MLKLTLVMDECFASGKDFEIITFKDMIFNARHVKTSNIIVTRATHTDEHGIQHDNFMLPPAERNNLDYVFMFACQDKVYQRQLYQAYGHLFENVQTFSEVLSAVTHRYGYSLVVNFKTRSVSYYCLPQQKSETLWMSDYDGADYDGDEMQCTDFKNSSSAYWDKDDRSNKLLNKYECLLRSGPSRHDAYYSVLHHMKEAALCVSGSRDKHKILHVSYAFMWKWRPTGNRIFCTQCQRSRSHTVGAPYAIMLHQSRNMCAPVMCVMCKTVPFSKVLTHENVFESTG